MTTAEATHIDIPSGEVTLTADLSVPEGSTLAIVFAHAGRNDLNARTPRVTDVLNAGGFATLAVDLVTELEAEEHENLVDIDLLSGRLETATAWLRKETGLPIAYLGAGTAASAALWVAAEPAADVRAIVSFGSWPDLAASHLAGVSAPTLLIVGGVDSHVLELNRAALDELPACEHELAVVPGATHLFEQTGALEQATSLAAGWFTDHLR